MDTLGQPLADASPRNVALDRLVAESNAVRDDITDWPGAAGVFKRVSDDDGSVKLGGDGRIGILQIQVIS